MPVRSAEATWKGDFKSGQGWIKSETDALNGTYSAASRFEDGSGTNPEELIGAALTACYSMALSLSLSGEGHKPEAIDTRAEVTIEKQGDGYAITGISLSTKCDVPGIAAGEFEKIANQVKDECPVSKALSVPISLSAELIAA